ELKTMFAQQAEQELLQTVQDFHSCKQEEGQSVQKRNNKHKKPQLQLAAWGQNQGKGKNKLAYAPKPKIPLPPKRENPAKDFICHQYGDIGHWKRNCPQYLVEFLKNKKLSQGASSSGLSGSRKLKPGALSLYMSNGRCASAKAIGSFHLSLPGGLVIVLNNYNSIQVSRNNMVYFSAIPRDGIFEIDLSHSYTNMTTSVGNNSVFKSFFKKQKLTGTNFIDWYRQLRLVLSIEDKENYLEHLISAALVAPPGQQVLPEALAAHAAWVKGQKEVVVLMLLTMDLEIQRNLAHLGAYDMLQEIKAMYSKQAKHELLQTMREFHTNKQEEVSLILVSLNKDFDSFMQNYNMHNMGKTVNELHVMLKRHEETFPKKDSNPALHAIRAGGVQKNQKNKSHKAGKGSHGKGKGKMGNASNNASFASKPKTPPPPKKDNPVKDVICHQCGEVGHWKRNCPVYLAELMKKKKLSQRASTLGIFTIELYSFLSKSWIYDTGCGTHICITTQGLRGSKKLKPGALSLYVGDGHRIAVEAIGTYHLELPSGLVIVLNNCLYAPSITRGVISVSRLFDDGFINRFDDNNVISVSENNLVYFMAVPRDGIYEIDMSCSNTNDSSIRYGYVYLLKHKHEVFETVKEHGIIPHRTPPYTPQHNGVSESRNRTLLDMVRSMMSQTTLPKSFWDYALETVARILNMVPTKKVDKTPYEIWHGQAPNLSYLEVWGCEAFVKRDTLTKPDKLDPRSFKCIFVGYPKETIGYSFYSPSENKVFVAQNAEFLESKLLDLKASGGVEDLELI
nr:zinc finger, CCHC-type [Tanacetum cinerariifolium]